MDGWLAENGKARGFVGSTQAFYEMSAAWYQGRLEEEWEPLSPNEATELWRAHGFDGDFWSLS